MLSREQAVVQSLASARLEGKEPPPETIEISWAWARGELTDEDLDRYIERTVAEARAR